MKTMTKDEAQATSTAALMTFFESMDKLNANLVVAGNYPFQSEDGEIICSINAMHGDFAEIVTTQLELIKNIANIIEKEFDSDKKLEYYYMLTKLIKKLVEDTKAGKYL